MKTLKLLETIIAIVSLLVLLWVFISIINANIGSDLPNTTKEVSSWNFFNFLIK